MADDDPLDLLQPAATRVRDPVSGRSVWLAGVVRGGRVQGDALHLETAFTDAHTPDLRAAIVAELAGALGAAGWSGSVVAEEAAPAAPTRPAAPVAGLAGPGMQPHGGPVRLAPLEGVRHVVAVASGKGGVGKSTVAANLAVGLRRLGLRSGLVDADVQGPSVPLMLNATARPGVADDGRLVPVASYGVRCLSMGQLVAPGEAMAWRGPLVMDAVRQLLQRARWGELDVLVVDLPPGTGDAQLTLIQAVPLAGAVVVTTPQEVALADAVRAFSMFRRLEVPVLGLVENMAWYELPDGRRDPVFGEGGGERTALAQGVDLLAQVPLHTSVRRAGDQGLPAVLGKGPVAEAFLSVARQVAERLGLSVSAPG
ncbi:MAG: Mrp/NBP35 family ATP-binding protein [Alphaproteobacteria bacterium]|nr:Mrp/NBP35 family ATP-binding protein [Alphaproteobacteria bacterium]